VAFLAVFSAEEEGHFVGDYLGTVTLDVLIVGLPR